MTFLPIVERELRVASRRRWTYWNRFIAATIGLGAITWVMLFNWRTSPQQLGGVLFGTISAIMFLYIIIAGTQVTCDCLSEEKREGTLGLLFLTDLKGYDVVFGKLAATSLTVVYSMMAVVPVMAIPLLLGGVSHLQFWRVVIVAMNLMCLSVTTGLFASAVCRKNTRASSIASLLLVSVLIATPLIALLIAMKQNSTPSNLLLQASPAYGCFTAFDALYRIHPESFWLSAGLTQAYSWLFLFLACKIVPRTWQDKDSAPKQSFAQKIQDVFRGTREVRAALRTHLLNRNPYLWRAGRERGKATMVWLLLGVVAIIWCWIRLRTTNNDAIDGLNCTTIVIVHALFKCMMATEACRAFSEDRRGGAMELLLSTPLKPEEIIRGQRLALLRQFAAPVGLVLVINFIFLMIATSNSRSTDHTETMATLYAITAGFLLMDLFTLSWVGMWQGLRGKAVNRSANWTLVQVIGIPPLICFLILTFWGFTAPRGVSGEGFALTWIAAGVMMNVILIRVAKEQLKTRFRDTACSR